MQNINGTKVVLTGAIAWISAKLGILYPILIVLAGTSIFDYLTGCSASIVVGDKLSSEVGLKGILKKLSYFVAVGVALCLDWLILKVTAYIGVEISIKALFSVLIAVWLILNELLSILQNLNKMGTKLPTFLRKAITLLIGKVEQQGDITNKEKDTKQKAED